MSTGGVADPEFREPGPVGDEGDAPPVGRVSGAVIQACRGDQWFSGALGAGGGAPDVGVQLVIAVNEPGAGARNGGIARAVTAHGNRFGGTAAGGHAPQPHVAGASSRVDDAVAVSRPCQPADSAVAG